MFAKLPVVSLDRAVTERARIITVNNRLAKHLRGRSERRLSASGQTVWPSVEVLPLNAWLRQGNNELIDRGVIRQRLLSSFEETLLWERVIAASRSGSTLLRLQPVARAAANAYRLLVEWRLALPPATTPETAAFMAWCRSYEAACRDHDWLPPARLIEHIIAAIETHQLPLVGSVVFAGFDDLTPVLELLLGTLATAGVSLAQLAEPALRGRPRRFAAWDPKDEIQAAVAWAWSRMTTDPTARIGIVTPNLADIRQQIDHRFALAARQKGPLADRSEGPFHEFSLGLPLSDYPIVHDALIALHMALGERPQTEVSEFLRSPFIGGAEREFGARAVLDVELRRSLRPSYDLVFVLDLLTRSTANAAHQCPGLKQTLTNCHGRLRGLPRSAAPSTWAETFAGWLDCLGWPGDRPLNSAEFQAAGRLQELTLEFARLDAIGERWSLAKALHHLRELASTTLFQPAGRGAPIQVLGLLESAGMRFDHLWVLGLDDEHWPPAADPNSLLPIEIQRRHQLPHACAERERRFAAGITRRLVRAAPEVLLSCAIRDGDREIRPSPLIKGFAAIARDQLALAPSSLPDTAFGNDLCEWVSDDVALPPAPHMAGGAQLLSAQAQCPFNAVARFRLHATSPDTGLQEPDARLQGQLVHRSLELLWRALANQATLLQCTATEREAHVCRATDQALGEVQRARPDLYGPQMRALEKQRLCALLDHWLNLETERADFEVHALETRKDITLGGLTLQVRGDRIDRLADGRQLIIDYKTGAQVSIADWTEERLEQPQVPLYCLLDERPVAAATIAQINARRMAWYGLAAEDGLLPNVPALQHPTIAGWQELLAHWRKALHRLGNEIAAGHAAATPSNAACQYCNFPGLCRLWESDQRGVSG